MGSALRLLYAAALVLCAACKRGGDDDGGGGADGDTGGSEDSSGGSEDDGETGSSGGVDVGPWDSLDERPCPPDSFLSYENFGGPYILNYCTGCHASGVPADTRQGAPVMINFDDLPEIRLHAARIWFRAADQNETMPPAGAPGDEERALLGEWLACGAPTDAAE